MIKVRAAFLTCVMHVKVAVGFCLANLPGLDVLTLALYTVTSAVHHTLLT